MEVDGKRFRAKYLFQPFLRFYAPTEYVPPKVPDDVKFQPFLRFYQKIDSYRADKKLWYVSTLLEILPTGPQEGGVPKRPPPVSTLLEILPLMCSVLVGF